MKARNFEIPYYGGFTLTDYVPSLEEYFDIGKEIVCFKDIEDLEILINYYLENEGEEHIRERGVKKAREKYTYLNKFRDIFEAINEEAIIWVDTPYLGNKIFSEGDPYLNRDTA